MAKGPLAGLRVLEFTGLGPGPYAAMLLGDLGADVVRIDRPGAGAAPNEATARSRTSIALDVKSEDGRAQALAAIKQADVLIEGFRPGVMERLGLGPDDALAANPRLIYGRMTGWGQDGPLAQRAGHDIDYIALTGALDAIGQKGGAPVPPLNLIGDFGGGSLFLVFGICAALYERERSGKGQVVDTAIIDGAASMMTIFNWLSASGVTTMARGEGFLSGGAPYYRCYECADGKHVAVGALEPQFYAVLLEKTGADPDALGHQLDQNAWPAAQDELARIFKTKTRAEWTAIFEDTDACVAPVLSLDEAPDHPHMAQREVYGEYFGLNQPNPAPRFSRTPGAVQSAPPKAGEGGAEALARWGVKLD